MGYTILITETFDNSYSKVPEEIKSRFLVCLEKLKNGEEGSLRLHRLDGFKPPIFKFDVLPNKSWQVACHREGNKLILLTIGTHKYMDRKYK